MTVIPLPLWQFVAMALGLVALLSGALLLGWRLGRESRDKPMFMATVNKRVDPASILPADDVYLAAQYGAQHGVGGDA